MLSRQAHRSDVLLDGSPGFLWTIKDLGLNDTPTDFSLPFPEKHAGCPSKFPSIWHLSSPRFPLDFDVIRGSYGQPATVIRFRLSSCHRIDAGSPPFKLTLLSKFRFPYNEPGTDGLQMPGFFTVGLSPPARYRHPNQSEGYYSATYVYEPDLGESEGSGEGEKEVRDMKLSLLYRGSHFGINSCVSGRVAYRGLAKAGHARWEVRIVDYPPTPNFPSPHAGRSNPAL